MLTTVTLIQHKSASAAGIPQTQMGPSPVIEPNFVSGSDFSISWWQLVTSPEKLYINVSIPPTPPHPQIKHREQDL